jgi:glycosyltransferase involved in cell wall biosynthesis
MQKASLKINNCIIRHGYFPDDPRDRKMAFALIETGHSLDVICLKKKGQKAFELVRGVRVFRIPLTHKRAGWTRYFFEYSLSFLMISCLLIYLFIRNRYRVIQVCTMPDFLVFVTLIPKLCGAKIILDLHEPEPELWITKYGQKRLRVLLWPQVKLEQWAIRYADWSITVTETLRRRFAERGANINNITVIPNVTDEKAFDLVQICEQRKSFSIFRLVTHGTIARRYGHEITIKAVNHLRNEVPNLRFEILGDGEYKNALINLVEELGCGDRVSFLGHLPHSDLVKTLIKADVGVIAMERSPYSELIDTNKMYEYIHLRKPIIASKLPGVEINFDDSCMMLFEPGNYRDLARCIVELYNNPEKRYELAENAYSRYEKMRWSITNWVYCEIFEKLAKGSVPPSPPPYTT